VDADTDQSIVAEILGYNEDVSDINSAQFYWEDNAQCNDADGQYNAFISLHATFLQKSGYVLSHQLRRQLALRRRAG
jgi:hypothetical protein